MSGGNGEGRGKDESARPETAGAPDAESAKTPRCPICGKPRDDHYRPFCSKRCADVDLGRWLKGSYAIPVTEEDDEDGDTPEAEGAAPPADRRREEDDL